MMLKGIYNYPSMKNVIFGRSFAEVIKEEVESCHAQAVLLIASGTLARETNFIEQIRTALGKRLVGVCSNIAAHTPRNDVVDASNLARANKVDLLVTIGGGSATDAAKMIALCLGNNVTNPIQLDTLHSKIDANGHTTQADVKPPSVRSINIPTTLAAAEYSDIAACTDTIHHIKEVFGHPLMMSRTVILDPLVTMPTPEWLLLSTGIRAVDHAVETICSSQCHPLLEANCLYALRLLGEGLKAVKEHPDNINARLNCQIGAWMSMIGVQSGMPLGASHGIGHALGGTAGVPHGYTSCVMLPHVLRFNYEVNAQRQALVSEALGQADDLAADIIAALVAKLGLPTRLRDVGIKPDILDKVAEDAMHDLWIYTNPRKIDSSKTVRQLLELAW